MIALLAGLAFGQNAEFKNNGRDCNEPAAIFGTSGFANAQQALDTNANTYSAAAFAERLGLDQPRKLLADKKTRSFVVWEVNETFDVARAPVYHPPFDDDYVEGTGQDCDEIYRVAMRGADLQ